MLVCTLSSRNFQPAHPAPGFHSLNHSVRSFRCPCGLSWGKTTFINGRNI